MTHPKSSLKSMSSKGVRKRVVIMGAAGRDFHNFNMVFRGDTRYEVVAFTATQIPEIADRYYPPALAGSLYPDGIPIVEEAELASLCRAQEVDQVVFAYSDVPHDYVMERASIALAGGADFVLLGPSATMLKARVPVVAVSAVRTGCGKSQVTRWLAQRMRKQGIRTVAIRHPMPYGDLAKQAVQRFANRDDLEAGACTIEEREEYEPLIMSGTTVYAGVDYAEIVAAAEAESDVILWDGGNNDFPFIRPNLHIVLADPLRPGNERQYYPGDAALRMADIVVVAKANVAREVDIQQVIENARTMNSEATIIRGASQVALDKPEAVKGKRVLVVEDGPTITHGGMGFGAGYIAAKDAGAAEIVDPRGAARGELAGIFARFPHIGTVLPAMGYHPTQCRELEQTINASDADVIVAGTPCDLDALLSLDKPVVRARFDYADLDTPGLGDMVEKYLGRALREKS